jgi:hypothetical protein
MQAKLHKQLSRLQQQQELLNRINTMIDNFGTTNASPKTILETLRIFDNPDIEARILQDIRVGGDTAAQVIELMNPSEAVDILERFTNISFGAAINRIAGSDYQLTADIITEYSNRRIDQGFVEFVEDIDKFANVGDIDLAKGMLDSTARDRYDQAIKQIAINGKLDQLGALKVNGVQFTNAIISKPLSNNGFSIFGVNSPPGENTLSPLTYRGEGTWRGIDDIFRTGLPNRSKGAQTLDELRESPAFQRFAEEQEQFYEIPRDSPQMVARWHFRHMDRSPMVSTTTSHHVASGYAGAGQVWIIRTPNNPTGHVVDFSGAKGTGASAEYGWIENVPPENILGIYLRGFAMVDGNPTHTGSLNEGVIAWNPQATWHEENPPNL